MRALIVPTVAIIAMAIAATPASGGVLPAKTAVAKAVASESVVVVGGKAEASWPKMSTLRVGFDTCYDSDGGLPEANEEGRRLKLKGCYGTEQQSFLLENGVLYVGYQKAAQVVPDIKPDWTGCLERWLHSEIRFYRFSTCSGMAHATGLEANLYDPNNAIIRSHTPANEDVLTAGRPLRVAPVSAKAPPSAIWEYVPGRKLIRASGTNLCITPPPGDTTPDAPLILDDCDRPMKGEAGAPGDDDGRARISFRTRSANGGEYW